jgi:hypothetical protein
MPSGAPHQGDAPLANHQCHGSQNGEILKIFKNKIYFVKIYHISK